MKNPVMERRRLLDALFDKIEKALEENVIVIAELERKQYASRMDSN